MSTHWKLYTTNEEGWEAMLEACSSAVSTIDLEQFIFVRDEIGKKFIDVCARKAKEGVRVRFLWDAAGSFSFFGSTTAEELRQKGIELLFFKTLLPSFFRVHDYRSWYFRNHRRTLVVDGKIGFTGSICVYEKTENWRDTVVRLEGPVVKDMSRAFERMRTRALGKKVPKVKGAEHSDHEFQYVTNNPLPRKRFLYHTIIQAIRNARTSIHITTPYFVPTRHLSRVLRLAAHRGVEVKIIIPTWTDHPLVDLAARTFFTSLLESGVQIYLHKGPMIHAKTIVIDHDWSSVGTLNLDNVSLLYNFEANLISTNRAFTDEISTHFGYDLIDTEQITLEDWKRRYWVEKFAGFFIRFVRDFL